MKVLRYVSVVLFVVVSCRTIAFAQHHLPHNIPDFCRGSADTVGPGQTMVISGKVTKGCIRVEDGGRLVIRSNTTLIADMIFGLPGSRLEGGTPAQPLDNVQIIGRNGSLNRASDPEEFGRGLVWLGSVRLHGVPKTSFARLTEEPIAGQGQIFAQTTGWRPGDRLLLLVEVFVNGFECSVVVAKAHLQPCDQRSTWLEFDAPCEIVAIDSYRC